ncbi:MAG: arylsulfatase [Oceanococcus sp.]
MKKSSVTLGSNKPYVLVAGLLLSFLPGLALASERPNVVLIVGDDVGFSDLGAYGSEIETPNLDQLAASGTLFSNYHTTASCSPTRSMLLTGVDNHRNGVGNMDVVMPFEHKGKPGYDGVLNHKVVTLATLLRKQGYHTYHIGKWHLGITPDRLPIARGFERTIAMGDTGADNWEQRTYLPLYDKAHWYADGEEHQLPDDFYSSRYFVDKAIEFIDSNVDDGKPFFSYIGFQAVHIPIQAPAEFVEKYHDTYRQGWHKVRQARRDRAEKLGLIPADAQFVRMSSTEDWDSLSDKEKAYNARKMAVYAGMLDAMDHHIGRLIAHLKSIGEYDNTLFVFVSDNGAEPSDPLAYATMGAWVNFNFSTALEDLGSKGAYAAIGPSWASAASSPGAFFKFWAGEGGVRVPFLMSWPQGLPAKKLQSAFAHVKDITPTILELTQTPNHNGEFQGRSIEAITGTSLAPLVRGEAELAHPENKAIGYELAGNAALYKGEYKLVRNLPPLGDGQWHLYNMLKDPGEVNDLREQQPERYLEMQSDYEQYTAENGVLEMPEGYDYLKQTFRYTQSVLRKRWGLQALKYSPIPLLALALFIYWRRRKAKPRAV